jgi:pantoate kinase
LQSSVFVPGHITGFFEIYLDNENPLRCGSRGAGFCIDSGAIVDVRLKKSEKQKIDVTINGEPAPYADTSRRVVDFLLGSEPYDVKIDTALQLPVSQGLGMSGAGALGAAIAIDRALGLKTDREILIGYAHSAEVESRTGLGDVIAQSRGGLELRTEPGAPPYGNIEVQPWEADILLVVIEPPLSTKRVLTSPDHQDIINAIGSEMLKLYRENQTPANFLELSRRFTVDTGLASEKLNEALEAVPEGYGAGMAMLGNTLFIAGPNVNKLIDDFNSFGECITTRVYNKSPFDPIG